MSRVLPILFNTEMVRAILDGRKTVTRRIIKIPHGFEVCRIVGESGSINNPLGAMYIGGIKRPPYQPGDILYVRETWERLDCCSCEGDCIRGECPENPDKNEGCYVYRATHEIYGDAKWRPSIHMPKEAARIWLKVTDVRVERIKDMTLDDFLCEGITLRPESYNDPENAYQQAKDAFLELIKRIYPDCTEDSWFWVIGFERCEKPESEG